MGAYPSEGDVEGLGERVELSKKIRVGDGQLIGSAPMRRLPSRKFPYVLDQDPTVGKKVHAQRTRLGGGDERFQCIDGGLKLHAVAVGLALTPGGFRNNLPVGQNEVGPRSPSSLVAAVGVDLEVGHVTSVAGLPVTNEKGSTT